MCVCVCVCVCVRVCVRVCVCDSVCVCNTEAKLAFDLEVGGLWCLYMTCILLLLTLKLEAFGVCICIFCHTEFTQLEFMHILSY